MKKRCHRRFHSKFLRHGCVVDLCSDIPMEIVKKAKNNVEKIKRAKISKPGVVIDRRRIDTNNLKPGNSNICLSWGDPHITTF